MLVKIHQFKEGLIVERAVKSLNYLRLDKAVVGAFI